MFTWGVAFAIWLVLSIVIGIIVYMKTYDEELGASISCFLVFIFLVITLIMLIFTIGAGADETNIRYESRNIQQIYSLQDTMTTKGEYYHFFIIGYGQIESDFYYYTLVGSDKEGYLLKKFKASEIYVITDEENKPYYSEKYKIYDLVNKKNWFFGGLVKQGKPMHIEDVVKRELHLSKNYIKQDYNIDLK